MALMVPVVPGPSRPADAPVQSLVEAPWRPGLTAGVGAPCHAAAPCPVWLSEWLGPLAIRERVTMSNSKFPLEEPIRQRLHALDGLREPTADGDRPRTGDAGPASDPLALDPLSPVLDAPGPDESTGPVALDPL